MALLACCIIALVALTDQARGPADPFGDNTITLNSGRIVELWRNVRDRLARDDAEIASCIPGSSEDCFAAIKVLQIIAEAKHYNGMALIGHINRSINLLIRPAPAAWVSAFEAIKLGRGDCKSYAIAKYFALREAGIAPMRVRLVAVHNRRSNQDHMIVAVYLNDRWLILDSQTLTLLVDREAKQYSPLLVLDDAGVRTYGPAFGMRTAAPCG